jgi:G3E family GTPase
MHRPKPLDVAKPVKLIFVGGFLGSGKTTALGALARDIIRKGLRVGIVTNDQSGNLADTVIVQQMLAALNVPVEEVVEGCFCCKFDDLIHQIEKILVHEPDILLGEPVGSCTDFVAAVAHPIKIHYRDAFTFAPFSTMVDPERVRELLLKEMESSFPEEVSYLFEKQLEEADLIVLNKCDLLDSTEKDRLVKAIRDRFPEKEVLVTSALKGAGIQTWLENLISGRPGANTVLRQIDYDRYAQAEAILGWLNAAVKVRSQTTFATEDLMQRILLEIRDALRLRNAGIAHLKLVLTSGGKSTWANLTDLRSDPRLGPMRAETVSGGTLLVNARVKMEPAELETVVRNALASVAEFFALHFDIVDLQCFSPAYPNPPYRMQEDFES